MTATLAVATVGVVALGFFVVGRLRPGMRPLWPSTILRQDRLLAIAQARTLVRDLLDLDVSAWHAGATVWADPATVQCAGLGGSCDPWWLAAGLIGSWRVRFIGPADTVLVGVGPRGELVHLEGHGAVFDRRRMAQEPEEIDLDTELLARLDGGDPDGVWQRAVAAGVLVQPFATEAPMQTPNTQTPRPPARTGGPAIVVERPASLGARVVGSDAGLIHVRLARSGARRSGPPNFSRRQGFATLAPFVALLIGIVTLLRLDLGPAVIGGLVAGICFFVAAISILPQMVDEATVTAYDLRVTSLKFRRQTRRQALIANLTGATTVVAAVAVGLPLQRLAGGVERSLAVQTTVGVATGVGMLGVVLAAYAVASATGRVRLAPELNGAVLARAGQSWRHIASVSVQSAVSEEAWCRLLVGAVVWMRSGGAVAGIVTATLVWVAMHDFGGVTPRWARCVELVVLGCAYGALIVLVGFVAAITAHASFNALMLGWPLRGRAPTTGGVPA